MKQSKRSIKKDIKGFWFLPKGFLGAKDFAVAKEVLFENGLHLMSANTPQPVLMGVNDLDHDEDEHDYEVADRIGFHQDYPDQCEEGSWVDKKRGQTKA